MPPVHGQISHHGSPMNALEIYEQAERITDPERRRRFLDESCGGDAALRARVEAMLGIAAVPESFLGRAVFDPPTWQPPTGAEPAADRLTREPAGSGDPLLGAVIGGVKLERLVGRGGMGRVYAGTQASTGGTAAVKVLMPHVVSDGMLKRFEQEARLLARLRHPGIAQIYTAGAHPAGGVTLPYFVMEYIAEARSITDHAESNRLDTIQRLELFRKACEAVAHGHEHGVIHRDLKPANILVDRFGQPKVIDFGVAKCTDADLTMTTLTAEGGIVGTLRYMSPEQASGDQDAITVRSDVHALGVILYELLAGQMPFDFAHALPIGVAQVIKTQDPKPLSSVSRAFRGDLDAITAKCLEKDRHHRYASAAELHAEIGRYLAGEPILTRPVGFVGGLMRLFRKHKTAAAAVAGVAASLVAAVVGISVFAHRAEAERIAAETARNVARQSRDAAEDLVGFMTVDLRDKLQPIGRLDLMGDVLKKLEEYHDARSRLETTDDESLTGSHLHMRGQFHQNLGSLSAALNDGEAARAHYEKSLAILEPLVADNPHNLAWKRDLAAVHQGLGDAARTSGDPVAAEKHYEQCMAFMQMLAAENPTHGQWQRDLAAAHQRAGNVAFDAGKVEAAAAHFMRQYAILEALTRQDPENAEWQRDLAASHERLGVLALTGGDAEGARRHFETLRVIMEKLTTGDAGNTRWQRDLAGTYQRLAVMAFSRGDSGTAKRYAVNYVEKMQALAAWDPRNAEWQRGLATGHELLGSIYQLMNDTAASQEECRKAHSIMEKLATQDPRNAQWRSDLAISHRKLGDLAQGLGDLKTAREHYETALALVQALGSSDPNKKDWQTQAGWTHSGLGHIAMDMKDYDAALTHFEKACLIYKVICERGAPTPYDELTLAGCYGDLGDVASARKNLVEAQARYQDSLVIRERVAALDPQNPIWQADLSMAYQGLGNVAYTKGDFAAARRLYEKRLVTLQHIAARGARDASVQRGLAIIHDKLGDVAASAGDIDEARRQHQEAARVRAELSSRTGGEANTTSTGAQTNPASRPADLQPDGEE